MNDAVDPEAGLSGEQPANMPEPMEDEEEQVGRQGAMLRVGDAPTIPSE